MVTNHQDFPQGRDHRDARCYFGGSRLPPRRLGRSGPKPHAKTSIVSERKRVAWLGSTASEIAAFPVEAKLKLGTALRIAQEGGQHVAAKPMRGPLR
jgi:hypothetical protein